MPQPASWRGATEPRPWSGALPSIRSWNRRGPFREAFSSITAWRIWRQAVIRAPTPANGDYKLAVDELEYKAFNGISVPRGLWGYGIRQTKQVYEKPAAVFDAAKLQVGAKTDLALLFAGGTLVSAGNENEIKIGEQ